MKKMFKSVLDINGVSKKYPVAEDGCVFFITKDDKFFIYSLYTKRDLSGNELIEISKETYFNEVDNYKAVYAHDPIIVCLNSYEAVKGVTAFSKYKATVDNTSIEELYRLNMKGDD